jgi:hypothetical protein
MAAEEPRLAEGQQYPGGKPVPLLGIYALMGYMLLMTVLTFVSLIVLWPPVRPEGKAAAQAALEGAATPSPTPPPPSPPFTAPDARDENQRIWNGQCMDTSVRPREGVTPLKIPFMGTRCVYDEDRLFLIVLFAGALGGLVHALRSLGWYIGNRRLVWSWSALYFLTPFTSAAIALIFYFVIRGGFFSPSASVSDTNPAFFAALAALIGMFTEEAINKLRSVAETVLTPKEQGRDHVGPAPVITSVSPPSGPKGGGTLVTIVGDNFQPGVAVTFGGSVASVESVEAKLIKVKTPEHAVGQVNVVVTNPDKQSQTSANAFEYTDEPPPIPGPPAPQGPPTLSAVQPDTGRTDGGEQVTITGTNFVEGASVTFGGQAATGVTVVDANTITLLTPANAEGAAEVVVTNPDGSSTSPAVFHYTLDQ